MDWVSRGVLVVAMLAAAGLPAAAQSPASSAPSDAGSLTYGSVDKSTVRVFAVGTVDVATFEVDGRRVSVANTTAGHGTGFVADPAGLIVTAHHVVNKARHVVVRLPGEGGFFAARVVHSDDEADIAVLKIDAKLGQLEIPAGAPLRVRQTVYTVGYPMDATRTQPQSARGIVAGQLDDGTIQLDIAVNPGNSGGPLLDERDRVVGMVVARGNVAQGVQGIGFAVPAARLAGAVAEARRRIQNNQVLPLSAKERQSATVVDELVQRGALHELREAADLQGGLESRKLENTLESLTARVRDADLLVFIAGNLWNGALVIDVGGVREIGKTTLTDGEARSLASRLRSASLEACRRAVTIDKSVADRSPFVKLAFRTSIKRGTAVTSVPGVSYREAPPNGLVVRLPAIIRLNPDKESIGGGFGLAASFAIRSLHRDRYGARFMPFVGVALGGIRLPETDQGDVIRHGYLSAELGVAAEVGDPWRCFEGVFAWAPGSHWTEVEPSSGAPSTTEQEYTALNFRAALAYRIDRFQIGAGLRLLTGPTFWLEPVFIALAF